MTLENFTVCIVGLGYVGLPLAEAFAQKLKVIGFDLDKKKSICLTKVP
jgi:UDP-N-acetyl-D-mannosaminuronate dehydrogenase